MKLLCRENRIRVIEGHLIRMLLFYAKLSVEDKCEWNRKNIVRDAILEHLEEKEVEIGGKLGKTKGDSEKSFIIAVINQSPIISKRRMWRPMPST